MKKAVKVLFENYPNATEFHETSDGQFFKEPSYAETHAKTLEDKTVEKYEREVKAEGGKLKAESDLPNGNVVDIEPNVLTQEQVDQANAEDASMAKALGEVEAGKLADKGVVKVETKEGVAEVFNEEGKVAEVVAVVQEVVPPAQEVPVLVEEVAKVVRKSTVKKA